MVLAAVHQAADVETTLHGLRITEPVLLARAAILDEAARAPATAARLEDSDRTTLPGR